MENNLAFEHVTKRYVGKTALNDLSLTIPKGKIIGLLGPNGSGKTTLLKIAAGLLTPNSGRFIGPDGTSGVAAKEKIAFLPDAIKAPGYMRVRDAFSYYGDMYPDFSRDRMKELVSLLDLDLDVRIKNLSKGMQERVWLGVTLSRNASIFLLDEPLGGIDPVGKARIIDAILSMNIEQASIVVSTHLVRDIERLFDRVVFMSEGRVAFQGDCDDMREKSGKTVEQAYLEVFVYAESI